MLLIYERLHLEKGKIGAERSFAWKSIEIPFFFCLENPQSIRHCSRLCSFQSHAAKSPAWQGPAHCRYLPVVVLNPIKLNRIELCGNAVSIKSPLCRLCISQVLGRDLNQRRGRNHKDPCVSPPDPVSQAPWFPCTALVSMPRL